jgi:hypothetical protein
VIDVDQLLKAGNDRIDGVGTTVGDFCDAQSSANSYQHAMRAYYQSVATAQALATAFVNGLVNDAIKWNTKARAMAASGQINLAVLDESYAIYDIGEAQHTIADSTSPPHAGYQRWYGIPDGIAIWGPIGYAVFALRHHLLESPSVYANMPYAPSVVVASEMHQHLLDALNQ